MNVCFKRIKNIAEISFSEHIRKWTIYFAFSVTFLCVNFTAINKEYFNKNFLKISQHPPENTCVVSIFFYKVTGLRPSGLQHRCFLVNNMKFLRTTILKNFCQLLTSAFFKLILWKGKKIHSINKVTETHQQIWKYFYLNAARCHEKKSLKCVIKPVPQTYLFWNVLL